MRQKIYTVLVALYLLAAFVDYIDREGLKKGLWDNILWREGRLPLPSFAKGLLWPIRLLPRQDAANEAAFYPPSQPIAFKSGTLQMILRCNDKTQGPELFIYILDGQLLTEKEHDKVRDRMMKGSFDSEFAKVKVQLDSNPTRIESWEIDLTGQIVSPLQPHILLSEIRNASFLEVNISRGEFHYSGRFPLKNKIPPRWVPCGKMEPK